MNWWSQSTSQCKDINIAESASQFSGTGTLAETLSRKKSVDLGTGLPSAPQVVWVEWARRRVVNQNGETIGTLQVRSGLKLHFQGCSAV